MRFCSWLGTAALVVGVAASATAQQAASAPQADPGPAKIAFVNVKAALLLTDEGKARIKELQEWIKPRQDELERLGKEINDLRNEAASRRGVASDEALAELNRRLVAKQREAEDKQRSAQRDIDERQGRVLGEMGKNLQEVVTSYADANRYTAVFVIDPETTTIAYLANSADITATVVKLYNQRFPWPRPAAPAAK